MLKKTSVSHGSVLLPLVVALLLTLVTSADASLSPIWSDPVAVSSAGVSASDPQVAVAAVAMPWPSGGSA